MTIRKVSCQGCGSSLEVSEDVRYVTCNYCDASLEIVHDTTVTHSLLLKKLEKSTDRLVDEVAEIRLGRELEQLDRAWEKYRAATCITGSDGQLYEPSENEVRGMRAILMVTGILITAVSIYVGSPLMMVGIVFILVAWLAFDGSPPKRAVEYRLSKTLYEQRRGTILQEIQAFHLRRIS